MALCFQQRSLSLAVDRKVARTPAVRPCPRAGHVARAGNSGKKMDASGYVEADNTGRGNIFPSKQQAYMKKGGTVEGLGGGGGIGVIGGIMAVLAVLVVAISRSGGPESLQQVAGSYEGDGLSVIAQRIQKSI